VGFRGDRLQALREFKGWSRAELARRTGLNRTAIGNLETGATPNPRSDTVDRLVEALDITPNGLTMGDDQPIARMAVTEALARYRLLEPWASLEMPALMRASLARDAPTTVDGWRAYVEMRSLESGRGTRQAKVQHTTRPVLPMRLPKSGNKSSA